MASCLVFGVLFRLDLQLNSNFERPLGGDKIAEGKARTGSAPASRPASDRSLRIEPRSPLVERLVSDELWPYVVPSAEWSLLIEAAAQAAGRR